MGSLNLFISCKTAAALASMLLFSSCLHLSYSQGRRGERSEEGAVALGIIRSLERFSSLPAEGSMQVPLPPLRESLLLRGTWGERGQELEVWCGGEILLSSLLPLRVEGGSFEIRLPTPGLLSVIRRENRLLLKGG